MWTPLEVEGRGVWTSAHPAGGRRGRAGIAQVAGKGKGAFASDILYVLSARAAEARKGTHAKRGGVRWVFGSNAHIFLAEAHLTFPSLRDGPLPPPASRRRGVMRRSFFSDPTVDGRSAGIDLLPPACSHHLHASCKISGSVRAVSTFGWEGIPWTNVILRGLIDRVKAGGLSRRGFVRRMAAVGLARRWRPSFWPMRAWRWRSRRRSTSRPSAAAAGCSRCCGGRGRRCSIRISRSAPRTRTARASSTSRSPPGTATAISGRSSPRRSRAARTARWPPTASR